MKRKMRSCVLFTRNYKLLPARISPSLLLSQSTRIIMTAKIRGIFSVKILFEYEKFWMTLLNINTLKTEWVHDTREHANGNYVNVFCTLKHFAANIYTFFTFLQVLKFSVVIPKSGAQWFPGLACVFSIFRNTKYHQTPSVLIDLSSRK